MSQLHLTGQLSPFFPGLGTLQYMYVNWKHLAASCCHQALQTRFHCTLLNKLQTGVVAKQHFEPRLTMAIRSQPFIRLLLCRLDQGRALVYGIGVFSGIVTALFPLSVVKTRQMASPNVSGDFRGSILTARMLYRTEGLIGFYRGFGTVVSGAIPVRMQASSIAFTHE